MPEPWLPEKQAADASAATLLEDDPAIRAMDGEVSEALSSFAEEDMAESEQLSASQLAAVIDCDLAAFLDYDFSSVSCQSVFSAAAIQEPAAEPQRQQEAAGPLMSASDFMAQLGA